MRITKTPQERRKEILETAMQLFCELGYEQTTITKIAEKMNVAQGLFYRYFSSKEELFDEALEEYACIITERIKRQLEKLPSGMAAISDLSSYFSDIENEDDALYKISHGKKNKDIHLQISFRVCEKLLPIVKDYLYESNSRGEMQIEDSEVSASFIVFGQLGMLLLDNGTKEEKIKKTACIIRGTVI